MKIPFEDLECSMSGLECCAVQATKHQYLQLDQNNTIVSWSCCYMYITYSLTGLGHATLDNFSTDQMVIELTNIKITNQTIEELKQNIRKPRGGHRWNKTGED